MANIKAKEKSVRQNEKRRMRNKSVKSSLKTAIRKFRESAATNDVAGAETHLQAASRELDKAVSKGVIHRNQAAQRKSKMAAAYNKLANAA